MVYIRDLENELRIAMDEVKPLVRSLTCPIHKRKARLIYDYDNRGINAYIKKCCCQAFADVVAEKLEETKFFDNIEIVNVESKD